MTLWIAFVFFNVKKVWLWELAENKKVIKTFSDTIQIYSKTCTNKKWKWMAFYNYAFLTKTSGVVLAERKTLWLYCTIPWKPSIGQGRIGILGLETRLEYKDWRQDWKQDWRHLGWNFIQTETESWLKQVGAIGNRRHLRFNPFFFHFWTSRSNKASNFTIFEKVVFWDFT